MRPIRLENIEKIKRSIFFAQFGLHWFELKRKTNMENKIYFIVNSWENRGDIIELLNEEIKKETPSIDSFLHAAGLKDKL